MVHLKKTSLPCSESLLRRIGWLSPQQQRRSLLPGLSLMGPMGSLATQVLSLG
jgi:hypothetical protein